MLSQATLPLGRSPSYEGHPPTGIDSLRGRGQRQGERPIWVEARVLDKLTALRGRGESYTATEILRVVELESQGRGRRVNRPSTCARLRLC
jgi:hypothetical protein